MLPGDLSIRDFSFDLPNERIAIFPLEERDQSKLLVYRHGSISESIFSSVADELQADDFLVFNKTRVVHARLFFQTESLARIEIFCLSPYNSSDIASELQKHDRVEWTCLVGNARKWKDQTVLKTSLGGDGKTLEARLAGRDGNGFQVVFSWNDPRLTFGEILERAGTLPIPPYLNRNPEAEDELRYQTIYAEEDGSVAAPTAGLHFTPAVFSKLKSKGIKIDFLTLHVGAGTFKPVKAETMAGHSMHTEEVYVSLKLIKALCEVNGRVIPVGTTSFRTLESLYWSALKLMKQGGGEIRIDAEQWEPYSYEEPLPEATEVFRWLIKEMENTGADHIRGTTSLLIAPGYKLRVCGGLITNFHQPESTLILLVSALIGEDWKKVYKYALDHNFRFLSYGDSSLLLP